MWNVYDTLSKSNLLGNDKGKMSVLFAIRSYMFTMYWFSIILWISKFSGVKGKRGGLFTCLQDKFFDIMIVLYNVVYFKKYHPLQINIPQLCTRSFNKDSENIIWEHRFVIRSSYRFPDWNRCSAIQKKYGWRISDFIRH